MGFIASTFNLAPSKPPNMGGTQPTTSLTQSDGSYAQFARQGYAGNEIVYAAIELLATSAAEPRIIGKRWRRAHPMVQAAMRNAGLENASYRKALGTALKGTELAVIREAEFNYRADLNARGIPLQYQQASLVRNGFIEQITDHPLIRLLNNPNPFMSRFQFYATLIMDRYLAGNSYVLKVRGPLGNVEELWRLRPDRVRVIPDKARFIAGYTYTVDNVSVTYPAEDVIHWKTRNPFSDYYGQPPLAAFMERISIDNYMRRFLSVFFERGGSGPGAILTTKGPLTDDQKGEIRDRLRRLIGVPHAFTETLILDNTESTYQRMGLDRGLTDALPKDINAVNESRLALAFGIPGSILGLLIGYESSSYANKRADWQVLWDVTLTPLFSDLDDVLNLSMVPEFSGVDEVCFDLSTIRALQEDVDAIHKRARDNYVANIWSQQEARAITGVEPEPQDQELFYLPAGAATAEYGDLGVPPEPPTPPEPPQVAAALSTAMVAIVTPKVGRRPLIEDESARATWEQAQSLRAKNPRMTQDQIAARIGVTARTLRNYRDAFGRLE
jgi:HK97 family phage portal protein